MRNTLPLSFRTPVSISRARSPTPVAATPPPVIPTIKLTAATPSVAGTPSANSSLVSTILAPKPPGEARKKVVPKKSKMGLLSVGSKKQDKGKDLSDVKRRVGVSSSSTSRSFDIYVDPTDDPDIGEVVFVQKKKSRAGLDGIFKGALGDVTNTNEEKGKPEPKAEKMEKTSKSISGGLKVKEKREEKEKWWTIGRSRRDSKEKAKEKANEEKEKIKEEDEQKVKSNPPDPIIISDSRQRAHSFDSGILLNTPTTALSKPIEKPLPEVKDDVRPPTVRINTSPTNFGGSRPGTPTSTALLSAPSSDKPQGGSIALRAMRSIARIGSWAQLRNTPSPDSVESSPDEVKKEKKIFGKTKRTKSVRSAASSFEAGGLTPVSGIFNNGTVRTNKSSTGTIMTVSSLQSYASGGSSAASVSTGNHRLSVASSVGTVSSGSCKSVVEPILANGRQSKRNSGSSVRWDDQVDTVKDKKIDTKTGRESRGKIEGRRRPAISALFPDAIASKTVEPKARTTNPNRPLLTLSAASPDRNYDSEMEVLSLSSMSSTETPVKKPRPRPMSENMLGRVRPRGVTGDDVEGGFMSILETATSDLANLINRLDLQATPDASPMGTSPGTLRSVLSSSTGNDDTGKFSLPESPSKRAMKTLSKESSVSSLRPYTSPKSKLSVTQQASKPQIGEQIAPWPAFSSHLETLHETSPVATTQPKTAPTFRLSHKRTLSPPAPAMDPLPVFHPLPAAKAKNSLPAKSSSPTSTASEGCTPRLVPGSGSFVDASSQTFGVRPSRVSNGIQDSQDSPTATGKFRTHERKRSSLVPFDVDSDSGGVLMDSMARRALGMRGTMGSVASMSGFDPDEPDSDIPDELHVILCASRRNSACSTLDARDEYHSESSLPPSPGGPPSLPLPSVAPAASEQLPELPIFRALLIDDQQNEADIDEMTDSSDDDGKSFDFTGELKQLNESGAADRRSFVLQLEDAFKTQAQIDIDGLGAHLGLQENPPPMPPLPAPLRHVQEEDDSALPTLSADTRLDDLPLTSHLSRDHLRGLTSKASDGKLNRDFKFGGRPTSPTTSSEGYSMEKPITLSDIIPPLSHIEHVRSQSMSSLLDEDNSVLKSIYAQAIDLPERDVPEVPPMPADARIRLESDSSEKQRARQEALSQLTAHSRQDSEVSFSGMSSFSEVRRGFEFNDSRPVFYPPANTTQESSQSHRFGHGQQESVFSIASVSSYGAVLQSGAVDPFGYALPTRPMSDEMSMSVDDTFSFLRRDPTRQRVDSDASSFYFNSSRDVSKRHRRQNDSMASGFSGPPISLYNRSYGAHRKSDSSTSASSIAHAYGTYGASGGRVAWAKHHQRDYSVDSVASGYSARLGRPGVGDKMFESARELGMPLTSISASPSQSVDARDIGNRTSFDSILDTDRRSSMDDSLFDETGRRTSVSSASVFGYESHHPLPRAPGLLPPHQFRPVSLISVNSSHGTKAEDDTMITMLGGGHVRRRSLGSTFDGSPCARARRTHRKAAVNFKQSDLTSDEDMDYVPAVNRVQVVEKPSVASSMSHHFGEERMTMAQKGLLQRQSLEDSCLSGEGEDMSFSAPLVFRKPSPTSCPRDSQSSLSSGSGVDTPPSSISDTSSMSSGSQSSIDIGRLSALLANSTVPSSTTAQARARARARGQGHRRRISQAQASRSRNSVYETIEEEGSGVSNAASPVKTSSENACSPVSRVSVYEPDVHIVEWDHEEVGPALRKYFALRNEAYETVHASRQLWADTPFSIFALQSFEPPEYPHGMEAVLEHSQKTYKPLPSELRALRRRSRTLSRPSPYPRSRKTSESSLHSRKSSDCGHLEQSLMQQLAAPLQELPVNRNVPPVPQSPAPALKALNPFTPFAVKFNGGNGDKSLAISEKDLPVRAPRPRVASNARRTALGWSKRSTGKTGSENKENASFGAMMSPNESLRIVRPRPRGRATPSSRAVRV